MKMRCVNESNLAVLAEFRTRSCRTKLHFDCQDEASIESRGGH
jgi:hypothetical protein